MSNILRIKRRAAGGAAGAPGTLQNGELAYNEVDNILYYGVGTGGAGGSATAIVGIAGSGSVMMLTGAQTITGNKTFTGIVDFSGATSVAVPTVVGTDNSTSAASTAWVRGYAQPILGYTAENTANKGVANGYASLGADGLVPSSQLPAAVTGGMNYIGTWNANTNTPTLADGTGTKGAYYKVSTAGATNIGGNNDWTVGDLIVYNGATWDQFQGGSPDVVSVAGRIGAVTLAYADISGLASMAQQAANSVNITGGTIGTGVTISGNAANVTGIVAAGNGGTGLTSYAIGDLIQASGATTLSKLAAVATGNVLISGGVTTVSSWGKVGLTTHVSGTLPVANGGTGATTLTGHISGNGTGAFTASSTIPMTDITGTLPANQGGTGQTVYAIGDLLYASGTGALSRLADVATGSVLLSGGVGVAPAWGQVSLTATVSGILPVANGGSGAGTFTAGYLKASGTAAFSTVSAIPTTDLSGSITPAQGGTGITAYAIGDLIQASGATAFSRLASVATGNVLISGGVTTASSWGKVGLTTHVSGTLPVANGGTGLTTYAVGDLVFASATGTLASLSDVATGNVLISGGVGVAPSYGKVGLTTHVIGTLPVANGGSGAVSLTGYLIGNGTGAFTAATTIPNTAITGLGTMSTQNATAVAITGGTIDGISLDGGTF